MARGPGNQGARDPRGRAEGKRQVYQQVWPRRNGLVLSAEKLTFSKGGGYQDACPVPRGGGVSEPFLTAIPAQRAGAASPAAPGPCWQWAPEEKQKVS